MAELSPPPIVAQEIRIVDKQDRTRILLSTKDGVPSLQFLRDDGLIGATVSLDAAGRPMAALANPSPTGPTAALEIDDKGAHVKFDRPGGASAYLFLNNAGVSGVVLIDPSGKRRLQATVATDGTSKIERLDDSGKALP